MNEVTQEIGDMKKILRLSAVFLIGIFHVFGESNNTLVLKFAITNRTHKRLMVPKTVETSIAAVCFPARHFGTGYKSDLLCRDQVFLDQGQTVECWSDYRNLFFRDSLESCDVDVRFSLFFESVDQERYTLLKRDYKINKLGEPIKIKLAVDSLPVRKEKVTANADVEADYEELMKFMDGKPSKLALPFDSLSPSLIPDSKGVPSRIVPSTPFHIPEDAAAPSPVPSGKNAK